jgi:Domain of unknown function (DUF4360)
MKKVAAITGASAAVLGLGFVFSVGELRADNASDTIKVEKVTYGGTGCPMDSARVEISPDQTAFTVIYDQFVAERGPGIPLTAGRKNCQLNILLHIPQGFTYAIAGVDYRGYNNLAAGASAEQKSSYYFTGEVPTAESRTVFAGPMDDTWQTRDEVETASLVFAPCGVQRQVNINTQLKVTKGTSPASSSSFAQLDSEDGSIKQIYHLAFRTCPPNP